MRLINVNSMRLESFDSEPLPPYAVLSHTWGREEDELSYSDVCHGRFNTHSRGLAKLRGCRMQALRHRLEYVWIDTCCIDQANAVEVTEAINSMFRWYQNASVCYVYLSELASPYDFQGLPKDLPVTSWFRRGWTLQELLAPKRLEFYDMRWRLVGDRSRLASIIEGITGIPLEFLTEPRALSEASIAQRMSWAARRVTRREEDTAYCLLGIFNVAMPMIYGEGKIGAFARLQREILREMGDDSILAWGLGSADLDTDSADSLSAGALAQSPSDFAGCGQVVACSPYRYALGPVDSRGFVEANVILDMSGGQLFGILMCGLSRDEGQAIGVPLHEESPGWYIRPRRRAPKELRIPEEAQGPMPVKISKRRTPLAAAWANAPYRFYIDSFAAGLELVEAYPNGCWNGASSEVVANAPTNGSKQRFLIRLRAQDQEARDVIVVFDFTMLGGRPEVACYGMPAARSVTMEGLWQGLQHMNQGSFGGPVVSYGTGCVRPTLERRPDEKARLFEVHFTIERGLVESPGNETELEELREEEAALRAEVEETIRKEARLDEELARQEDQNTRLEEELQALNKSQRELIAGVEALFAQRAHLMTELQTLRNHHTGLEELVLEQKKVVDGLCNSLLNL